MSKKILSLYLKIIIVFIMFVTLYMMFRLMPLLAEISVMSDPEVIPIIQVILPLAQAGLVLFASGLIIIIYMLRLFDRNEAYSVKFIHAINTLTVLCAPAVGILVFTYIFLAKYGGPGPGLGALLFIATIGIIVLANVLLLIKAIIKDTIKYKEDSDLTI